MQVHRDFAVTPWNLDDVDFGAVAALVAHLVHTGGHDPERRPVPGLARHLAPRHVRPERALELPFRIDRAARVAIAILPRAQQERALAVKVSVVFYPKPVPPLPIAEAVPLRLVKRRSVKFVLPDQLPLLARWRGGSAGCAVERVGERGWESR